MEHALFLAQLKKTFQTIQKDLSEFLFSRPAISVGLSFLIALVTLFHPITGAALFIFLLWITNQLIQPILFFFLSLLFFSLNMKKPIIQDRIEGIGYLQFESASKKRNQFVIQAKLIGLLDESGSFFSTESRCYFCTKLPHPLSAKEDFLIKGIFHQKNPHFFTVSSIERLTPLMKKKSWFSSFQDQFFQKIDQLDRHGSGDLLLKGCLFGYPVKQELKVLFSQLGLSHILAISGFHFSLFSLFIHHLFAPFFKQRLLFLSVLIGLLFYFLLIATTHSVLRAFICIGLSLIGHLLERKNDSLNLLFIALILILIFDPNSYQNIGFQLSFFATFGILTYYRFVLFYLNKGMPKRTYPTVLSMNLQNQIGYLILQLFKPLAAVNLSATFITLPLIFFLFHQVSILSFFYNLFIPPLIGFGLMAGLAAYFIAIFLHFDFFYQIVTTYLSEIVLFLEYYPKAWNYRFQISSFSSISLIYIEATCIFLGFLLHISKIKTEEMRMNLY